MRSEIRDAVLYGIVDRGYVEVDQCVSVTSALIAGGAEVIQLRAKQSGLDEIEALAQQLSLIHI